MIADLLTTYVTPGTWTWTAMGYVAAILAVTTNIMIRKRTWKGYALSIPSQLFYGVIVWQTMLYPILLLLSVNLVNAVLGLFQWRKQDDALVLLRRSLEERQGVWYINDQDELGKALGILTRKEETGRRANEPNID